MQRRGRDESQEEAAKRLVAAFAELSSLARAEGPQGDPSSSDREAGNWTVPATSGQAFVTHGGNGRAHDLPDASSRQSPNDFEKRKKSDDYSVQDWSSRSNLNRNQPYGQSNGDVALPVVPMAVFPNALGISSQSKGTEPQHHGNGTGFKKSFFSDECGSSASSHWEEAGMYSPSFPLPTCKRVPTADEVHRLGIQSESRLRIYDMLIIAGFMLWFANVVPPESMQRFTGMHHINLSDFSAYFCWTISLFCAVLPPVIAVYIILLKLCFRLMPMAHVGSIWPRVLLAVVCFFFSCLSTDEGKLSLSSITSCIGSCVVREGGDRLGEEELKRSLEASKQEVAKLRMVSENLENQVCSPSCRASSGLRCSLSCRTWRITCIRIHVRSPFSLREWQD